MGTGTGTGSAVDVLYRLVAACAGTLDAADAGIFLSDVAGDLEVVAATNERSHLVGRMQLDAGEGPGVDAQLTGRVITVDDVSATPERWPTFAAAADGLGYRSMHAIPLRLPTATIGSLNLFRDRPGPLTPDEAAAAQALADIASIGIRHERAISGTSTAGRPRHPALDSRAVIEQARGVLAQS